MFRPNPRFIAEMSKQPAVRRAIEQAAREVKSQAVAASPRGTGHYAGRFKVTTGADGVFLGNDDFAAHMVEFGTVNNPPYAPLRRGVRAARLRFTENSK